MSRAGKLFLVRTRSRAPVIGTVAHSSWDVAGIVEPFSKRQNLRLSNRGTIVCLNTNGYPKACALHRISTHYTRTCHPALAFCEFEKINNSTETSHTHTHSHSTHRVLHRQNAQCCTESKRQLQTGEYVPSEAWPRATQENNPISYSC